MNMKNASWKEILIRFILGLFFACITMALINSVLNDIIIKLSPTLAVEESINIELLKYSTEFEKTRQVKQITVETIGNSLKINITTSSGCLLTPIYTTLDKEDSAEEIAGYIARGLLPDKRLNKLNDECKRRSK